MIDIKRLEKEPEYFKSYKNDLVNRKDNPQKLDELFELNSIRKKSINEMETKKAELNKVSQEIAKLKKQGSDSATLIEQMKIQGGEIKRLQDTANQADEKVQILLKTLPNHLHSSVPKGTSEESNQVIRVEGKPVKFDFEPKDHLELGVNLGIVDVERAAKVTGARFAFLLGKAARLERALIQWMMDTHSLTHGYEEIWPPFLVNSESLFGTGQFPKFKDDVFHLQEMDFHLVPTAEVPVTNFFRDEILSESDLPKNFVAFSPCFRSEAGSHGKDTRGLIRQHQFDKVELVKFCHPDKSYEEHEILTQHAEFILHELELPFRTVSLCSGDIGFGAAKCYDIEVWLPSQNAYREISSCSNFEDFQARRASIRYRPSGGGKPEFVHTLNGSGLAVGRTLIAIFENYQRPDGSIEIPPILHPYTNGMTEIRA